MINLANFFPALGNFIMAIMNFLLSLIAVGVEYSDLIRYIDSAPPNNPPAANAPPTNPPDEHAPPNDHAPSTNPPDEHAPSITRPKDDDQFNAPVWKAFISTTKTKHNIASAIAFFTIPYVHSVSCPIGSAE